MAPRNSTDLVTQRLRSFYERIGDNPEDDEYEFLDVELATVHEINVLYRRFNRLRHEQWSDNAVTHTLDALTRAKARAAARHAATRRARTLRSRSRSRSRSRTRSRSRNPVSGGTRRRR